MEVQLDLSNRENGPSTTERAAGKLNRLYGSMGRPPSLPLYLLSFDKNLDLWIPWSLQSAGKPQRVSVCNLLGFRASQELQTQLLSAWVQERPLVGESTFA